VSRPRVLVTDTEERSSLAACRSLHAAGYHVSAIAGQRPACSHWSRSVDERLFLDTPRNDPENWVIRLAELVARGAYDIVLPGTEASLVPISEHRELLQPYTTLALPPHPIVLRALDKPALTAATRGTGLDAPASVECLHFDEAFAAARSFGFPAVVKPIRSFLPFAGTLRQTTARIVHNDDDVVDAASLRGLPLTVQEYLPAAKIVSCAGVRAGGRVIGLTVARYERTFPSEVGSAALAMTIEPPPGVREGVEEILARVGWEGIFELELLESGDRLAAIDLNPRLFGWVSLAVGAGADLPALWCDYALGRPQRASAVPRPGVRYRWEIGELAYVIQQLRRGRVRDAVGVLRPYRRVVHAKLQLRDPFPIVARIVGIAARLVRRPARRVEAVHTPLPVPRTDVTLHREQADLPVRGRR